MRVKPSRCVVAALVAAAGLVSACLLLSAFLLPRVLLGLDALGRGFFVLLTATGAVLLFANALLHERSYRRVEGLTRAAAVYLVALVRMIEDVGESRARAALEAAILDVLRIDPSWQRDLFQYLLRPDPLSWPPDMVLPSFLSGPHSLSEALRLSKPERSDRK